jgi:ABC-type multidrug transport system ATPase subunit
MRFGGLPPERAREARGHIGLLSHAALVYSDLSGLENVAFYAALHRIAQPEAEAARLLDELGLAEAMRRPARTYSRGMLQRLGLARALVGRPSLVLLDEPFTGLDRASTARVVDRVRALAAEGAMVLMISHELATTADLADACVILARGQVVARQQGRTTVEHLRQLYAEHAESTATGTGAPR